jgi:predicted permease
LTAIVILALGMGASVAIFAFVDAALIKPLPYPDPTRLVAINESTALFPRNNLSYPDYQDWKRINTVFSSMDVYTGSRFEFNTPAGTESVHGLRVSAGFFQTLGVRPILGRDFLPNEDATGASPVVLLRYGAWQRRFGGNRNVVGRMVNLNGVAYTVVGVLPQDFEFAPRDVAEMFAPLQPDSECEKRRSCHDLDAVGRLKDGVSVGAALAQMKAIALTLETQYPDSNRGQSASVMPLSAAIVGDVKPVLLVLMGGAGLLLLIACVNVSSLMLVRAESRRREIAVRGALGASRARLSRQFITEALALVVVGSAVGLAIADAAMKALSALISKDWMAQMPFLRGLGLHPRVLMFAASLALLAGVLFSLTPILHFRLSSMRDGLTEGTRGSAGRLWRRMGANLVVIELATAVVLLAGAGLLAKSLYKLLHEDLGFTPSHLATVNIGLPPIGFEKDSELIAFEHVVLERAGRLPGVESAAAMDMLPVSCNCNTDWVRFEVNDRVVSTGLFSTLQVELKSGRLFTNADGASSSKVVVVNQAFAQKYFPGEDAVGKRFGDTQLTPASLREIVGVVENFRDASLDEEQWPAEYEPFDQDPSGYFSIVLRTAQDPATLLPTVPAMIHSVSPAASVDWLRTMQEIIDDSQAAYMHRSTAYLVSGFAVLALVLGVVGLYGVVSYSVSQRTREIGVRMALGAQRSSVYKLVLGEAGRLTVVGVVLGLAGAVGAARLMSKLLFGVQAWDAVTLIGVALVLGVSAIAASYFPARRASLVNPTEAQRAE